jgi:hypothetical protein
MEEIDKVLKKYAPALSALGSNMSVGQNKDMLHNVDEFNSQYVKKYQNGQESHGGNMWEMGAYQALQNAKEEVLDQWSYLMTIEKILGEIKDACERNCAQEGSDEVLEILNRRKRD